MIQQIKAQIKKGIAQFIEIQQHLHAHPELSYKEFETASFIEDRLKAWGIPFQSGVANTGVVGIIEGRHPKKRTIALRADMDALPIKEENEISYKSENEGVMHACGH